MKRISDESLKKKSISRLLIGDSSFLVMNKWIENIFDLKNIYNEFIRQYDKVVWRKKSDHPKEFTLKRKPREFYNKDVLNVYWFVRDSIEWTNSTEYTDCSSFRHKLKTYKECRLDFYPSVYKMCEFMCFGQKLLDYILLCLCHNIEMKYPGRYEYSRMLDLLNSDYHIDIKYAVRIYNEELRSYNNYDSDDYDDYRDDYDDYCDDDCGNCYCGYSSCYGICGTLCCGCIDVCRGRCGRFDY